LVGGEEGPEVLEDGGLITDDKEWWRCKPGGLRREVIRRGVD